MYGHRGVKIRSNIRKKSQIYPARKFLQAAGSDKSRRNCRNRRKNRIECVHTETGKCPKLVRPLTSQTVIGGTTQHPLSQGQQGSVHSRPGATRAGEKQRKPVEPKFFQNKEDPEKRKGILHSWREGEGVGVATCKKGKGRKEDVVTNRFFPKREGRKLSSD